MAAVLACGPGSLLSHRDAAALWGLRRSDRRAIDVTVVARARRPQRGLTVHVTHPLDGDDHTIRQGIPVTSVARTLLDLAEVVAPTQLQRAYEEAERLELLDVGAIDRVLARSNGRRRVGALRTLLAYDPGPAVRSKSELESRFLDLIRRADLPLPQVNVLVAGFLVDAYWPRARLVVELQSYGFHSHRRAFERDHAKLARLKVAGCEVLALTWRQIADEPGWVAGAVRSLLTRAADGPTV